MRHATSLLYHVQAVASRSKWFNSCGTSGKLTLWTPLVSKIFWPLLEPNSEYATGEHLNNNNNNNHDDDGHDDDDDDAGGFQTAVIYRKFSFQKEAICWLDLEFKEKNSILDRDLNMGL